MKKILIVIIIVTLILVSCDQKEIPEPTKTKEVVTATTNPTETVSPTQEITPTVKPEPTPDIDPAAKLKLSEDEFNNLLLLWPIENSPIDDHGSIISFSLNSQNGINSSSLNLIFEPEKSGSELNDFYMELVVGEWEDSEYSAGPTIFGGYINDSIKTTCQISEIDSEKEVFLGLSLKGGSQELENIFDTHWPIGLFEVHESMKEEALFFNYLAFLPGVSTSLSRSWDVQDVDEVINFYKDVLANEIDFIYFEGDEYTNPSISCTIDEIVVYISESMDKIEISLTVEN